MKRSKVLATIGVAVLILGGCGNDTGGAKGSSAKGSDDRSPADQAYVDELVASVKEDAGDDPTFPSDQVECWVGDMVGEMVDGIGAAKLRKAGLTVSEDDPLMAPLVGCLMQGLPPGATGPNGATG
jgi:hypothetical protein